MKEVDAVLTSIVTSTMLAGQEFARRELSDRALDQTVFVAEANGHA